MNKKTNLIGGAILLAVIMFAAGYGVATMKNPNPGAGQGASLAGGAARGAQGAGRRGGAAGFGGGVSGNILSVDDQGFTINNASSGSAIIFISPATKMEKRIDAAKTDFKVGDMITVMGQKNPDGSYTAQNIMMSGGGIGSQPVSTSSAPKK